ncbi:MAG: hypothetical protein M0Q92_04290 [Methanoregula sp.]|jgi:hypothetical protein|nr:hypothetical protein [Methanoregula sp.]
MEIQTQQFLNKGDVIFDNGFERTAFRKSGSVMNGKPPVFPDLTPYTSSVFHTRDGSDDLYLTIVWHFVDGDRFLNQQGVLNTFYLERYGRMYPANITLEYEDPGNSNRPVQRTTLLNVTGFENNITAGYFTTIQYTGSKSPDYYIVYFGTVKSGNLSQQTPYLKRLMEPVFNPDNFNQPTFPVWPVQ